MNCIISKIVTSYNKCNKIFCFMLYRIHLIIFLRCNFLMSRGIKLAANVLGIADDGVF